MYTKETLINNIVYYNKHRKKNYRFYYSSPLIIHLNIKNFWTSYGLKYWWLGYFLSLFITHYFDLNFNNDNVDFRLIVFIDTALNDDKMSINYSLFDILSEDEFIIKEIIE